MTQRKQTAGSAATAAVTAVTTLPARRTKLLLVGMLVSVLVLSGWLVRVQALDPENLADRARKGRTTTQVLTAPRGDILDSTGQPLATTVERYIVSGSPEAVRAYKPDGEELGAQGAARELSPLLGVSSTKLFDKLNDIGPDPKKPRQYVVLAKEVTPQTWRKVAQLGIPGIARETTLRRNYPAGGLAGNVIGFLGKDASSRALAGLESEYDSVLRGVDGASAYERGAEGQRIPAALATIRNPRPGKDVQTTLRRDVQWYAQETIENTVREFDAEWGTVVVQNPKTGALLALAEFPTVDPNEPQRAKAADRGSRAVSNVIEPGSTAKVITASMALEEGLATPTTQLMVPYTLDLGRAGKVRDSHHHKTEPMTFAGVMAESSNTGTVMVGRKADRQMRHEYLKRFGFGQPTGLRFPGETRGLLAEAKDWDGRQEYNVMFGQGVSVNALQATSVFSIIANDGALAPPHLVEQTDELRDALEDAQERAEAEGKDASSIDPGANTSETEQRRVVSVETARAVRSMLESVVAEGTAKEAQIPGYRVAGKTGTAEAPAERGYSGYTASFIGMAPADDPELVVSVIVQRPTKAHYGGVVAAPAFQKVMRYGLQSLRVPPATTEPDLYPLTWK